MKLIINAEPDEFDYVLQLVKDAIPRFGDRPPRPGYGWGFGKAGGKRFFISEIKGGLSVKPIGGNGA